MRGMNKIVPEMKKYFAKALTCKNIALSPEEVSIRFLRAYGDGMIGDVEMEIKAHSFPERVKNQDKICLDAAAYVKKKVPYIGEVKTWLQLSELGHSW